MLTSGVPAGIWPWPPPSPLHAGCISTVLCQIQLFLWGYSLPGCALPGAVNCVSLAHLDLASTKHTQGDQSAFTLPPASFKRHVNGEWQLTKFPSAIPFMSRVLQGFIKGYDEHCKIFFPFKNKSINYTVFPSFLFSAAWLTSGSVGFSMKPSFQADPRVGFDMRSNYGETQG